VGLRRTSFVTYTECPKCQSPKALLAYEHPWKRCYVCPQCHYVWDVLLEPPAAKSP